MSQRDGFRLPKTVGGENRFHWGPVVKVHEIGPYQIVEYHPRIYTASGYGTSEYEKVRTQFHSYVDGKELGVASHTLDQALIECIAAKRFGACSAFNSRIAHHAHRLLGISEARYFIVLDGTGALVDYTGHVLEYVGPDPVSKGSIVLKQPNDKGTLTIEAKLCREIL